MPPKERLTAAQHLAKYGADAAFYVTTEEGANIICKPLPYCRLRGDTRAKVLEYLVRVSDKRSSRAKHHRSACSRRVARSVCGLSGSGEVVSWNHGGGWFLFDF